MHHPCGLKFHTNRQKNIIRVLYDPAGNGDKAAHLLEMWEGWQGLMNAGQK